VAIKIGVEQSLLVGEKEVGALQYKSLLLDKAKGLLPLKTAVVHPVDIYSLQGAIAAAERGLIEPILIGPETKIRKIAEDEALDISAYTVVHTPHSHAAAEQAIAMVREGKAEAVMKGKIHTEELMEMVVNKKKGLRTGRRMSHVFILQLPHYPKPLLLTDAVLNIKPNLMDKRDIIKNAIDMFRVLGMGTPRVAILSATEMVTEKLPSTLDATALCKMAERGQITGGILDGPLALDNALSQEAAAIKGIKSEVAGNADILVVPDLEAGNMLYKQSRFLSDDDGAGIVLGARVPVILTSRAANSASREASCALALIYVRNYKGI
jgi:phosphotransacetylase